MTSKIVLFWDTCVLQFRFLLFLTCQNNFGPEILLAIKFDFRCRNITGFTLKIPFQLQTCLGEREVRKKTKVTVLLKNKPNYFTLQKACRNVVRSI